MIWVRKILPWVLVQTTHKSRYLPEIVWSDKSWTHNIFRVYESIFWRRDGIRKEMSTVPERLPSGRVSVHYELYTVESVFAYVETVIRGLFVWKLGKVRQVRFALPNSGMGIPLASFAIAVDVADTGTATSTSPLTWSHTCTGSNVLLAIGDSIIGNAGGASAVTYAAAAATKAVSISGSGTVSGGNFSEVWFKGSAATGANTVSVTFPTASSVDTGAVSYTGAQSGSTKDASNSTSTNVTGTVATSVTTVANNCWVIGCGTISGGTSPVWSAPTQTSRWLTNTSRNAGQDNNAPKTPAGAVSIGWTAGGTASTSYVGTIAAASFAPGAGVAFIAAPNRLVRQAINRASTY